MKYVFLKNRLKIRWIWLLTYAVVLIFSLVINLLCYGILSRELKIQLVERNNAVLDTISENVDAQFRMIGNAAAQIATDKEVIKIIEKINLPIDNFESYELYQFVSDLRYLKGWSIAEELSDDLMIYFPHIDMITRQGTVHEADAFWESYCTNGEVTKEQWHDFLHNRHNNEYLSLRLFRNEDELIYVTSISPGRDRSQFVNLIFKINKERLNEMCENLYLRDYGMFAVVDKNDNMLLKFLPKENTSLNYSSMTQLRNKKEISCFEVASDLNQWRYVFVLPENIAYQSIGTTKNLVRILFVLYIALSVVMILYFIRMHEKPFKHFMKIFSDNEESEENENSSEQNEYLLLSKKIHSITDKNAQMTQMLERQQSVLKEYLLNVLLTGGEADDKVIGCLHFNPDNADFMVFIISVEPGIRGKSRIDKKNEAELALYHFSICNVLDELLDNQQCVFHSAENEKGEKDLFEMVDFTHEVVLTELGLDFTYTCGDVYHGREGIVKSYEEAQLAMIYCIENGLSGLRVYEELKTELAQQSMYSKEHEKYLSYVIEECDFTRIEEIINLIFPETDAGEKSETMLFQVMQNITTTVKRVLLLHGISFEKELSDFKLQDEKTEDYRDKECVKENTKKLISAAIARLSEQRESSDVVDCVIRYIGENYTDINLSLHSIADKFSINHEYLSKKFKSKTGIRLVDYINIVRIENAKLLMSKKDFVLSQVPEKVGFSNYRTFARVFTKTVGVAPKSFKD